MDRFAAIATLLDALAHLIDALRRAILLAAGLLWMGCVPPGLP